MTHQCLIYMFIIFEQYQNIVADIYDIFGQYNCDIKFHVATSLMI